MEKNTLRRHICRKKWFCGSTSAVCGRLDKPPAILSLWETQNLIQGVALLFVEIFWFYRRTPVANVRDLCRQLQYNLKVTTHCLLTVITGWHIRDTFIHSWEDEKYTKKRK